MNRLVRLGTALVVLLVASGVHGPAGHGLAAALPSIYVEYADDCTFTMHADGGIGLATASAPGALIPPGPYQVVLDVPQNSPSCPMSFQLQGPGVEIVWDFGGEALNAITTATFLPSSTYTAIDLRSAARGHVVFSTSAAGSSSSLVTSTPPTAGGKGQTLPDVVGSGVAPVRGVLRALLPRSGAIVLTRDGRRVSSLRAGRYSLIVTDDSRARGLVLRRGAREGRAVTGAAFVGRTTTSVVLVPGRWTLAGGSQRVSVTVVSS